MGWWFGRKSALPAERPFVPVWLQGEGEAGGFARGYEAQLDEVYRRNPVGLRAVRLVSSMVGALPLYAGEGQDPALKLVEAGGLLERIAAGLLLHGIRLLVWTASGFASRRSSFRTNWCAMTIAYAAIIEPKSSLSCSVSSEP